MATSVSGRGARLVIDDGAFQFLSGEDLRVLVRALVGFVLEQDARSLEVEGAHRRNRLAAAQKAIAILRSLNHAGIPLPSGFELRLVTVGVDREERGVTTERQWRLVRAGR